jgi:DNA-binding phage protein
VRSDDLLPHELVSRLVDSAELDRIKRDPEFARALFAEAGSLLLQGEPEVARVMLHNLVNATFGFEGLAQATGRPSKSLHRMLSVSGNPSMDNIAAIFDALRHHLGASIEVQANTVA